MPGRNCCMPQCTVSETSKHEGIKLYQVTTRQDEFYSNWRKEVLAIVGRYRVIDKIFKARIANGRAFICEKHYAEADFEVTSKGKRVLRLGAVPTLNLPKKSHNVESVTPRRKLCIVKELEMPSTTINTECYKDFTDFQKKIKRLKLNGWVYNIADDKVHFKYFDTKYVLPVYEIIVEINLDFTCIYLGWVLHKETIQFSLKTNTISSLMFEILNLCICPGLLSSNEKTVSHVCTLSLDTNKIAVGSPQSTTYYRAPTCSVLFSANPDDDNKKSQCQSCKDVGICIAKKAARQEKNFNTPAHPFAPLSRTHKRKLELALIEERQKVKTLTNEINMMKEEISRNGINIDNSLANDIDYIMNENKDITPFMKLFYEQQKVAREKGSMHYHPMIIRFCLSLVSKSASAYDELRSSGILKLPSRRTLRDYRNAIKPTAGFNHKIVEELKKLTSNFSSSQRNIVLSFDEMKIQENLVFDKYTGELIGFIDLGDPDLNYGCFEKVDKVASHIFAFHLRGIASDLKFSFAYFPTDGIKGFQIMPIFWDAVGILELSCDLRVIAAVSDGASPNRAFFQMHEFMESTSLDKSDNVNENVYRTVNLYASDNRYIWFFADVPHLMKTIRNCIYKSGSTDDFKRNLWNDGDSIHWYHFIKIVNDDLNNPLKLVPKLTPQHVHLTPYSKMNVRLAVQVLSNTVGKVLQAYYPAGTQGTVKLCFYINKFFDCLNARSPTESTRTRNEFCKPYIDVSDERFTWLKTDFLSYLKNWKESVEKRPGEYSQTQRDRMFLSYQTYKGINITVNSMVEATKYLLNSGVSFVLTERFNQDILEEYFGRQRSLGRRNDNPTVQQFGYQANTIRMQRSNHKSTGNTRGRSTKKQKSWVEVDNEPLAKRKPGNKGIY